MKISKIKCCFKKYRLLIVILSALITYNSNIIAQNYYLNYYPATDSLEIKTIFAQNLTTGQIVEFSSNELLHILKATDLKYMKANSQKLNIYPNPSTNNFCINFFAENSGEVNISILNISGTKMYSYSFFAKKGFHELEVEASLNGVFFININGETYSYFNKVFGLAGETKINKISQKELIEIEKENDILDISLKDQEEKTIAYTFGDVLLFKIFSTTGQITIKTLIIDEENNFYDGQYFYSPVDFYLCQDFEKYNYPIVEIGGMIWMSENLNTKYFNDGTSLENIIDNKDWRQTSSPAYSNYKNLEDNSKIYGKLYNWYTVTDSSKICPKGWYVPSDNEWQRLEASLGMENTDTTAWRGSVESCYLKSAEVGLWNQDSKKMLNSTGFGALPSGMRSLTGEFFYLDDYATWWTATEANSSNSWCRALRDDDCQIFREDGSKKLGLAIRCVYFVEPSLPVVEMFEAYYSEGSVSFFAQIIDEGSSAVTKAGFVWDTIPEAVPGENGIYYVDEIYGSEISAYLNNFEEDKTYFVRAFAQNNEGIGYSQEISFTTTQIELPTVEIVAIDSVYMESAKLQVSVSSDDELYELGIAWSEDPDFSDGQYSSYYHNDVSELEFSKIIENLTPAKTYYVRAFAGNSGGRNYSDVLNFSTLEKYFTTESQVNDIDGNIYRTVRIANTEYMTENLRTSRFNDGTLIQLVTEEDDWFVGQIAKACYYNFDSINNHIINGKLYDELAFRADNICPEGWKIADESDWQELEQIIGMPSVELDEFGWRGTSEGGKLKQIDLDNWNTPNNAATNQAGYSASGSGYIDENAQFQGLGEIFSTWVESEGQNQVVRNLSNVESKIQKEEVLSGSGRSIRCVKTGLGRASIQTNSVSDISVSSAKVVGEIIDEGESSIINKGVIWGFYDDVNIENSEGYIELGEGAGQFSAYIQNLETDRYYVCKTFATNSSGTSYSEPINFYTLTSNFFKGSGLIDVQGNTYKTIVVAGREWTIDNLKITVDATEDPGIEIFYAETNQEWIDNSNIPAYCRVQNATNHDDSIYGYLYNYMAIMMIENLCPYNWYIPTDVEWLELEQELGILSEDANTFGWRGNEEGGMLKEPGIDNWLEPNLSATNTSGLNFRPAGMRKPDGTYSEKGESCNVWANFDVQPDDPDKAYSRHLKFDSSQIGREENDINYGFSIRCVKDPGLASSILTSAEYYEFFNSIVLNASVLLDAGEEDIERGFIYSIGVTPTYDENLELQQVGTGLGDFNFEFNNISSGLDYHFRAYTKQNFDIIEYSNEIIVNVP